jgi:hypothetical protein
MKLGLKTSKIRENNEINVKTNILSRTRLYVTGSDHCPVLGFCHGHFD